LLNPTAVELEKSSLELVIAGSKSSVLMVEAGAQELSESDMLTAIEFGHAAIKEICAMQEELAAKVQPKKDPFTPPAQHPIIDLICKEYLVAAKRAAMTPTKFARRDALKQLRTELIDKYSKEALT